MDYKVFSGLCPDENCQTKLYFPAHKTVVECSNCGQRHCHANLHNLDEVTDADEAIAQVLKSLVYDTQIPKKGSDTVKVHGVSNYHCKLLSPLFTKYGMDKKGSPRLLSELGHGDMADCGRLLSNRAFLIAPEHIEITGYGRDQSGSVEYLNGLLDIIKEFHNGEELLIPIHADGDGHCLVHALSRATTGREIFWHALRENLVSHLEKNLETYKNLFCDFIDQDDWKIIIDEADPYHVTPDGFSVGLGNIHIFALANVLKRPIVLLDSLEGIKNVADYTAIFVPALVDPTQCRGNQPLCIAWSGWGHNHFIPLVGVDGKPLPTIPQALLPNIWGIDRTQGLRYLNINEDGSLTVAGGKPLQKRYLLRLISAMEEVFLDHHSVAAKLVADMHLYVYQRVGFVGLHPDVATSKTRQALKSDKIFRCLICNALSLANVEGESLQPAGYLFEVMRATHGSPRSDVVYNFPTEGLQCKYDQKRGCLVPYQFSCSWCRLKRVRKVNRFGETLYENGDPTMTPAEIPGQCCGSKHYWDGKEYENIPKTFNIKFKCNGKGFDEEVVWFYGDSDPKLNSNATNIASSIIKRLFENEETDSVQLNHLVAKIRSKLREYGLSDEPSDDFMEWESTELQNDETSPRVDPATSSNNLKSAVKLKSSVPTVRDVPSTSKSTPMEVKPKTSDGTTADSSKAVVSKVQEGSTVKIRVSTSDGRQETLSIDKDLNYTGLLNTVQKHFSILPERQVLKLGFPPKLLEPLRGKKPLGLRNGDRVMVEIKTEKHLDLQKDSETPPCGSLLNSVFQKTSTYEPLHNFLGKISHTKNPPDADAEMQITRSSENVVAALRAVSSMAELTGTSVWDYAVNHPELFRHGGAFYDQFARDIGLTNGRHCMLPLLPGRVFQFNAKTDEIQLCLEPTGHFPINPKIKAIIEEISRNNGEGKQSISEKKKIEQEKGEAAIAEVGEPMDFEEGEVVTNDATKEASDEDTRSETSAGAQESATKESKLAPGFTTLGPKPTEVSVEEAELKRQELLKVLKSKNTVDS